MKKLQNNVAPTVIKLMPQNLPEARNIFLGLYDDAVYTQAGGSGGWQVVDRPKRTAATQWMDRAIWSLSFSGVISESISNLHTTAIDVSGNPNKPHNPANYSIEPECLILENWLDRMQGSLEPPVFKVLGPVPGQHHYWVIYSMEFGSALRNPRHGFRYQQEIKLTLYEYQPPYASLFNLTNLSHVEQYKYNVAEGTQVTTMYQIGYGDTLRSIANQFNLGKKGVSAIQTLNGIRDPRSLIVGQTIMIPSYR